MATTASGTPYTVNAATAPGGDATLWAVATSLLAASNIPLVVYCHGDGGAYNQFAALGAWQGMRDWLIDNGCAWVEAAGGGISTWGNQAARTSYEAAVAYARTQLDIGPIIVLGRSMGGIPAYWLATQSSFAADVVGLIINSGVTDLWLSYQTGAYLGWPAKFRTAYGAADDAEFYANSTGFDPMQFSTALYANLPVMQLWGTADTTVPSSRNAEPWISAYGPYAESVTTDIRVGGDHSAANGSYLQVDAMAAFIATVASITPPPPLDPRYRRVVDKYRVIGGEKYRMAYRPQ